jgi:phosphatidylinositol kinase/protein kinase (PI-3  family)
MDKNRIAFAKAVMKRTAAKVHGLSADGHSLPSEEHARVLISQGTSAQHLSRMYEGWMAWL